jgi:hypothetical protein
MLLLQPAHHFIMLDMQPAQHPRHGPYAPQELKERESTRHVMACIQARASRSAAAGAPAVAMADHAAAHVTAISVQSQQGRMCTQLHAILADFDR